MLEKDVEEAIVAAVDGLGLQGLAVRGSWQVVTAGTVKGAEDEGAAALVVKVSPRSFPTFGICEVDLDVTLALAVRVDLDADGAKLVEYADAIGDLIQGWNLVEAGDELTDLAVPGVFEPGGVQVTCGTGPENENGAWTVVQNFTLRGTVPHGNNE